MPFEFTLGLTLSRLQVFQGGGRRVFPSDEVAPGEAGRLIEIGFYTEILEVWLLSSNPATDTADKPHRSRRSKNSSRVMRPSVLVNTGVSAPNSRCSSALALSLVLRVVQYPNYPRPSLRYTL